MRQFGKWFALLVTILVIVQLAPAAPAESGGTAITAEVAVSGSVPYTADSYTIVLTALEGSSLPAGAVDGQIRKTRTGAGTVTFEGLEPDRMGLYRYQVSQEIAAPHPSATEYDTSVYTVEFYATNAGGAPSVIIYDGKGEKTDRIRFVNTYAETRVTAEKVWDDADNQDGKRDTVILALSGTVTEGDEEIPVRVADPERVISPDGPLTTVWEGLPVYDRGREITYTVSERGTVLKNGKETLTLLGAEYTVSITGSAAEGFTVTNSHVPETVEATIRKIWDDNGNQDGKRPLNITMTLSDGQTVLLNAQNKWTATITGLPKYAAGQEIEYTWTENLNTDQYYFNGISTVGTVTTIINTHDTEYVSVTVRKNWDDKNNQDGIRPRELKVTLSEGTVVTLTEQKDWTATVERLPKYSEGQEIDYTWTEETVEGYELTGYVRNGLITTLTNYHKPEETSSKVRKVWVDGNNALNTRPASLTVTLSDGKTAMLNEGNDWTTEISGLPKYAAGQEISYSWTEPAIALYGKMGETTEGNETVFTNTILQEYLDISGTKTWVDGNLTHDNGAEITLTLTRTVPKVGSAAETVEAEPIWNEERYTYTHLEKYDPEGYPYTYHVTETQVEGYDVPVTSSDGYSFTNVIHDPMDTVISGRKIWIDGGLEHDNATEIQLTLTRLSTKEGSKEETVQATPSWEGNTYSFSGLDVYDDEGYPYSYSVSEAPVSGYETPVQQGTSFINTIYDPSNMIITGKKTWVDGELEHQNREEIVLTLSRISEKEGSQEEIVEAEPSWQEDTYSYSGLEVYDNEGYRYSYHVSEEPVSGYDEPEQDGYDFTNRIHDSQDLIITGTKTWVDGGLTHNNATEIALTLSREANGRTEIVPVAPVWEGNTYFYRDLDIYDDNGFPYSYTVREARIDGYEVPEQDGYNFINRIHDPMTIRVLGTKTWVDDGREHNNAQEIRLTLTRTAAGATETLNLEPEWIGNTYIFSGLENYNEAGYPYTYQVAEAPIPGYTTAQDGYNLTNTYTMLGSVTLSATKTLTSTDPEREAQLAAGQFTFELRNPDGTLVQRRTNAANGTVVFDPIEYRLEDLARSPIIYTIREIPGEDESYTYDDHILRATVTLTDNGDNTMTVNTAYTGGRAFANTWTPPTLYNLTVNYIYLNTGRIAAAPVHEQHPEGEAYDVRSPNIVGYRRTVARVTGIMPGRDVVEYVYYIPNDMILEEYETPLGLGQVIINIGDCLE